MLNERTRPSGRRPLTREEARARAERRRRMEDKERESRELARGPIDLPFLMLVLLLTCVGLVMLLSASFPSAYYDPKIQDPLYFFKRQIVFVVLGMIAMAFMAHINYQRLRIWAKPMLFLAVFLLLLVIVPGVGITRNHATRWLGIPGTPLQFQPSELAKLAVVLYFSNTISKKKDKMADWHYGVVPYAVILGIIALLMMREPHFSGTILILGVGGILMLVGGMDWRLVPAGLGILGLGAYLLIGVGGYGRSRIDMWLNPWQDQQGEGYQMVQSLLSIGSGGLLGVGLGKSRQKFLFLPEEHNDFIFSIVCEELGLIGAGIIMLLFAALVLRGYWIALHARDRFGSLLAVGFTSLIAMQTFLNMAVVTGLLPATGISLPFFSYGGTAISIQLLEMGVILSVSRQMKPTKAG